MKKQQKQMFLLGGLLLVCIALFLGARAFRSHKESQEEEAQKQESESLEIHTLSKDTINKISYEYDGETITLIKEGEVWKTQNDPDRELSDSYIGTMTTQLAAVNARTVIDNVEDLSIYGLAEGYRVISCETTTGESFTYYLGDQNGITGNYYIRLPEDEKTVYAVSNLYNNAFAHSLDDLTKEEEESTIEESTTEESTAEESTAEESSAETAGEDEE